MENLDPIELEILINNEQVKADSKKVKDDIHGIGEVAEETAAKVSGIGGGGIAAPLKQAGDEAEKAGKKAAASRPQWNGLGNSINQLSREIPAFAYSAQTGFLALSNNIPILADEIGRLKAQNDALVASGEKGVPVWKQVVKGLFSWQTLLSVGVALLTLYGAKFIEFISGLVKTKEALDVNKKAVEALNKAYESTEYQKVIKDLIQLRSVIKLAKDGLIDKKVALKEYNESLGKVYKATDDLNEAEKIVIEKAPAYIEAMLYKAAATYATADAAKLLAENQLKQFETQEEIAKKAKEEKEALAAGTTTAGAASGQFTNLGANTAGFRQKVLKEELDDLEKDAEVIQDKSAKIVESLNQKAAEIAKAAGLDIFGGDEDKKDPKQKDLNDRKNLLEKIADLDREYARKQLDRDKEELQALKDKFTKVRQLIEEFNKDPKNLKKKIDISGLGVIQNNAEADLTYKQETRSLKEELEKQKQLYREIEEFKATFGLEKTKERYGDQLAQFESYAALLKSKIEQNQGAFSAVNEGNATGGESDRVRLLQDLAKEEKRIEAKKYDELLAGLMDYQKKRKLLIEKFEAQQKLLLESGNGSEAEELNRVHKEELNKLDDAYAKSTDEYKALIKGVEGLSETAARSVISSARKMVEALLAAGRISEEVAAEIYAKINELEETVDSKAADKFNKIASQIAEISHGFLQLGDAVAGFDEGLGDTISTMGELGNVAASAASSIAGFLAGGPAGIVQGISGAISAIGSLFSIGSRARESERRARQELLEINHRIEDGERRMNQILRERNIQRAQEVELTLQGLEAQKEALALAQSQNSAEQDALFAQLQQEKFVSGSRTKKYGGFLGFGRKTKVVDEYSSMLGLTYEEIERLYSQGKLKDRASELFEQLRDLKEEGEDINGMLSDLQQQANEIFTGTTAGAIADGIIDGLRQGYDSFEDFAGDIEGLLQNAMLNAIKYNVLEEPLQELYERFAEYAESEGELTEAEARAIRNQYQQQVQNAIDQYEQWSQVLDQDLLSGGATQNGLAGAIRRELTEETGSELTGLFRGQYDITKRHLHLHERNFELDQRNYDATRTIMQNTALIEQNTAATVIQLQNAVTELKTITQNTRPQQTARDLGRG